jgi:transketolase
MRRRRVRQQAQTICSSHNRLPIIHSQPSRQLESSNPRGNGLSLFQPYTDEQIAAAAKRARRSIIEMTHAAASGHPGGSLSAVEILAGLYLTGVLRHDPADAQWPDRDRFILSKAHAVPVLYAFLAECGYIPFEELVTFRRLNSRLQGHSKAGSVPGVEMSGGSLGQGLSYSIGQALAARLDKRDYRVYCLLGDGELDEGQVWEAAMAAAHYGLDNLTAIVDRNGVQNDGFVVDIMRQEPLDAKWRAFGWDVQQIDGHDQSAVLKALANARQVKGCPSVIIAKTIKGKGVSFMENTAAWHGRGPNGEERARALAEIGV